MVIKVEFITGIIFQGMFKRAIEKKKNVLLNIYEVFENPNVRELKSWKFVIRLLFVVIFSYDYIMVKFKIISFAITLYIYMILKSYEFEFTNYSHH